MTSTNENLINLDKAPNADLKKIVGPSGASSPRLLVRDVLYEHGRSILQTVNPLDGTTISVELLGAWAESPVEVGQIVRVVLSSQEGDFTPWQTSKWQLQPVIVNDNVNFLIHHPDTLINGTTVSESFFCPRKAVLSSRTPDLLDYATVGGESALFGSMIHELFQVVLILDSNTRDYTTADELSQIGGLDLESFFEAVEDVLHHHADDIYAAKMEINFARQVLHKVVPQITDWYRNFMGFGNFNNTDGVQINFGRNPHKVVVSKVHDIEELVWSPVLGLKGKIDASVFLRIDGYESDIAVLELKTGKSVGISGSSHVAQVSLYNLLMSDRKGSTIRHGLLTYIPYKDALESLRKSDAPASQDNENSSGKKYKKRKKVYDDPKNKMVANTRGELIGLIMQRNMLARHLRLDADVEDLPPLYHGDPDKCSQCFAKNSCLVQHRLLQNGSAEAQDVVGGPGEALYSKLTGHLSVAHATYYKFWRNVLADEEELSTQDTREIWTMSGSGREERRRGIANLVLVANESEQKVSPHALLSPGQRVDAQFRRREIGDGGFLNLGFGAGDYVMISAERRWLAESKSWEKMDGVVTWQSGLSSGIIQSISADTVSVSVERSLTAWILHQGLELDQVLWRIDLMEMVSAHKTAKQTLEYMFCEPDEMARLRALVVDGQAPVFGKMSQQHQVEEEALKGIQLNDEQREAVQRSLVAKDYLLILGMPGTGKSETLAAIVLTWALRGKTVLLCAHINAAVDNLLERLLDAGFDNFVRVGRRLDVVSETVRPYHVGTLYTAGSPRSEVDALVDSKQVVATTCLSIHHAVVHRRRRFDLVVVDEASQVSQPICLGPLTLCAGPFVLVGDHYQLPPLLRARVGVGRRVTRNSQLLETMGDDEDDERIHVEESLFRRLCGKQTEAMVVLKRQYRMAKDIAALCNSLIYARSLQTGSDEVAQRKLELRHDTMLTGWRQSVVDGEQHVVFVDVVEGTRKAEAVVASETVKLLCECGLNSSDVVVLSAFRGQVATLREALRKNGMGAVETSTIDRYQGRDCATVVVSLAVDGREERGGKQLLQDWRRVNVALTRAKMKLVLIGNAKALSNVSGLMKELVREVSRRGWVQTAEAGQECS